MKHIKEIQALLALAGEFPIRKHLDYNNGDDRIFCNQVLRAVKAAAPIIQGAAVPSIEQVREFNTACEQVIPEHPAIHDRHINKLRLALIDEEFLELQDAISKGDPVKAFDALLDIQYVLDGAFLSWGFAKAKNAGMAEVHRSNMTKFVDGKPMRRSDGKIIKGPNYQVPDLHRVLSETYGMFQVTRNETATPAVAPEATSPTPSTQAQPAPETAHSTHTPGGCPETVGSGVAPGDTPDTANTPAAGFPKQFLPKEQYRPEGRKGKSQKGSGRNQTNQPHGPRAEQPQATPRTGNA